MHLLYQPLEVNESKPYVTNVLLNTTYMQDSLHTIQMPTKFLSIEEEGFVFNLKASEADLFIYNPFKDYGKSTYSTQ